MDKTFYIETFGCQMNVHDSEKMSGTLKSEGYSEVDNPGDADLIVFNTCSIREKAEQKFFSRLGRFKSLKKRNPNLKIAVAGCIAQQEGAKILQRTPYIDFIIGPQNIHVLGKLGVRGTDAVACQENPLIAESDYVVDRKDHIKALVTIMYGCNNFCSYCVVPHTRGPEQSRPSKKILTEIRGLAREGFKEVTLLGQNVNSYRSDLDFVGLLSDINKIDGLERIRFITSHPKDLSDSLIAAIRDLKKVCEHIHLPLQSGSSRILELMNRHYNYTDYMNKIESLRRAIPSIAITTDIISGFPQETEEDHNWTIRALKEAEFDGIFAFNYSPRPDTKAASLTGHIDNLTQSRRLSEILDLQNSITDRKNRDLEGSIQEILVETETAWNSKPFLTGRTRTNKIVNISADGRIESSDMVRVKIIKAKRHSLQGKIL
ncbi:MAG: tRNA (N6-isopentenyl adenosine(37)-C2)-methylthiotransferase MiaB [Dissulfurispiraceae bacterium]